ncbi:phosphotransferase enzyme family protein [Plantibacter sp. VKM Ac-2880]|uniref:phosphotransferase enzyme family protein n=1 Tax=Plantibacter sp. VKM Ac-2880 TaxID=2783827 RepID=UPI001E58F4FF|nr:phosphotransferase [Plantibacter sp. VKM Ac-2880]
MAHYPSTGDIHAFTGPPKPLAARITDWLESGRSGVLTPAVREQIIRFVARAPSEELSAQLVHGDFRSSNILCTGHDVTAVLDFEEARFDHPVMELAQSAVMLGTRFRDWGPVPPDVHTWLREGYESERPLTRAEADWWNLLVLWFSFLLVPPGEDPTGWGPAARALLPEMTT